MQINVLLVSKMESKLNTMRQMIKDDEIAVIGESSGGAKALDKIENLSPDVVIMPFGAGDTDILSLTERIIMHRPRTFVILLLEQMDAEALKTAVQIGAHNITEFPTSDKQFAKYIKSVYTKENTKLNSLTNKTSLTWMSKVITVFGSKGGLGKTTIATNLAVKLAENKKKVAIVDLDLQFGDIHIFLDIEPKDTIAELVQEVFTPNIDSVRSYMVVHSSGVHVLCAPKSPEYAEVVSAEKVQSLLSLLRVYYDYVIIDTPPVLNEITLTAVECSSTVLFVTGLDISILKNSKLSMTILDSLQQRDKIKVVVNRAVELTSVTFNDVEKTLNCQIAATIPSDYRTAVSALNRGVPFVTFAPNSKIGQAIGVLADQLTGGGDKNVSNPTANKKNKSMFFKSKKE